ncbi:hypothetical protein QBC39DRAFT_15027, partial [Podospora conica]
LQSEYGTSTARLARSRVRASESARHWFAPGHRVNSHTAHPQAISNDDATRLDLFIKYVAPPGDATLPCVPVLLPTRFGDECTPFDAPAPESPATARPRLRARMAVSTLILTTASLDCLPASAAKPSRPRVPTALPPALHHLHSTPLVSTPPSFGPLAPALAIRSGATSTATKAYPRAPRRRLRQTTRIAGTIKTLARARRDEQDGWDDGIQVRGQGFRRPTRKQEPAPGTRNDGSNGEEDPIAARPGDITADTALAPCRRVQGRRANNGRLLHFVLSDTYRQTLCTTPSRTRVAVLP